MSYCNQKPLYHLVSERITLKDDYEGAVSAKIDYFDVKEANSAVIYLHGYMDYFFQTHLSDFFINKGISFYALELRKYGSSLQAHHHANFCKDIGEYYEEIDFIIKKIKDKGYKNIILHGHSTGGLIATHYLCYGNERSHISSAILNSPFFAFNANKAAKTLLSIVIPLAQFFPFLPVTRLPSLYTESLHKEYKGRWDFDLSYKPIPSFITYFGWMRAILNAQNEIYSRSLTLPTLILHSQHSFIETNWDEEALHADAVLNVKDISFYAEKIYQNLSLISVENAVHDIVLSCDDVIDDYFETISLWLNKNF